MQFIDDAEFQVAIDLDGGGRITSLQWREMEFAVPFRGSVLSNG
jgi:aldose 1-epimerase